MIKEDLQDAIQKENFERAAKLRDVCTTVESITQSQSVVLEANKTGIFVLVSQSDEWYLYTIIRLHEGRVVDIISSKELQEDSDLAKIWLMIEHEYKITLDREEITEGHIAHSFSRINKQQKQQLVEQALSYQTSYIQSQAHQQTTLSNDLLVMLQKRYNRKQFPYTIECTDISHFG